jgi:hypothetical protein
MHQQNQINQINGIRVNKLYLVVTRREGYKDSYTRSYNLNATQGTLNELENVLSRSNAGSNGTVSDALIAKALPNIMSISATPLGITQIANGWGTQRLRFIMEVESITSGITMVNYIQGYSEYHDPSISGHIDPRMKFYINSIASVIRMQDPISGMVIVKPHSNFNVITDHFNGTQYQEVTDTTLKLIRPTDVMTNISNIQTFGGDVGNIHNYTDNVAGNVSVSDRANHNPIKHFTKTINSYINSKNMSDVGYDSNDVMTAASNNVSETNILTIPFIGSLHNLTGEPSPSTFSMDIMSMLDPGIAEKTIMIDNANDVTPSVSTILDTTNTEDLFKPNIESVLASTIAHSVSGMLIDNLLSEIDFSTTNLGGENLTAVSNARSFIEGIDITSYVNKVITNVNYILMPEVSQNGLIGIEMFVHSDVLGETTISISVNATPHMVFRYPTFADSLYSPVISDEANKVMFADDMGAVLDTTYAMSPHAQQDIMY